VECGELAEAIYVESTDIIFKDSIYNIVCGIAIINEIASDQASRFKLEILDRVAGVYPEDMGAGEAKLINYPGQVNGHKNIQTDSVFRRLSFIAFLIGSIALSVMALHAQAPSVPSRKPHPSFAGKSCVECHKQITSSKVLCMATKEQMCTLCHEIPAAGGLSRLTEASERLCLKCHTKDKFKGSFLHGPFAVGACVACHDPHGSNPSALVGANGQQMCLTCHTDMEARLKNAKFTHKAVVNNCTSCHDPHASDHRYELRGATPDLCAKCHENILRDYKMAAVKHAPVVETRGCLNCHDSHMGSDERLLVADGIDVCLKCHDGTIKIDKYELSHMGQLLAKNPEHHGPIQGKECSGCHKPHGSSYFRLLTNEYPKEFYTSFSESKYDLCFRCHDSTLVKEERTTTLTGFRDGDRNLHFVHVNKSPKGRTCRSCHETHASTLPKHIRVSVPFGKWNLPVGFTKTDNGGSCESGCHAVQKYERQAAQAKQK
jgi:predicted CXXCH cytochrome family protein